MRLSLGAQGNFASNIENSVLQSSPSPADFDVGRFSESKAHRLSAVKARVTEPIL